MATAKDLFRDRMNETIFSVYPDASILEAVKLLNEHNVGALLVMDKQGKVEGILSGTRYRSQSLAAR